MAYTLKPEEVGVFAIGGLGEIGKKYLRDRIRLKSLSMPGSNFQKMTSLGSTMSLGLLLYRRQHRTSKRSSLPTDTKTTLVGFSFSFEASQCPYLCWAFSTCLDPWKIRRAWPFVMPNSEINQNTELHFKNLKATFFRTTHFDSRTFRIVIHTPQGKIVCTGDFKFDFTPLGGNRLTSIVWQLWRRRRSLSALRLNQRGNSTFTNSEKYTVIHHEDHRRHPWAHHLCFLCLEYLPSPTGSWGRCQDRS